ncbi:hypothetical protein GCM10009742_77620 [Kribbella karoonensis]|uniref:Uncharacterized protein n=1 Tax=Kribbella karoonensis TaxID=324851 RepID=A0ABN2ER80_9ACTN
MASDCNWPARGVGVPTRTVAAGCRLRIWPGSSRDSLTHRTSRLTKLPAVRTTLRHRVRAGLLPALWAGLVRALRARVVRALRARVLRALRAGLLPAWPARLLRAVWTTVLPAGLRSHRLRLPAGRPLPGLLAELLWCLLSSPRLPALRVPGLVRWGRLLLLTGVLRSCRWSRVLSTRLLGRWLLPRRLAGGWLAARVPWSLLLAPCLLARCLCSGLLPAVRPLRTTRLRTARLRTARLLAACLRTARLRTTRLLTSRVMARRSAWLVCARLLAAGLLVAWSRLLRSRDLGARLLAGPRRWGRVLGAGLWWWGRRGGGGLAEEGVRGGSFAGGRLVGAGSRSRRGYRRTGQGVACRGACLTARSTGVRLVAFLDRRVLVVVVSQLEFP